MPEGHMREPGGGGYYLALRSKDRHPDQAARAAGSLP